MSYFDWANSKIQKLKWYDISLTKLSAAAFVLWIAKIWTSILSLQSYWYLIIAVVTAFVPLYKVFKK